MSDKKRLKKRINIDNKVPKSPLTRKIKTTKKRLSDIAYYFKCSKIDHIKT